MSSLRAMVLLFALGAAASAGTPGIFRGIVERPADSRAGFVYVKAPNGMMRLVNVAGAKLLGDRDQLSPTDLKSGTEIRVTAEQELDGSWRATQIEVLRRRASRQRD